MDFAVVKIAGKQFLVKPSQKLSIEGLIVGGEKEIVFSEILLSNVGGELKIGTPLISGVSLKAKVLNTGKGDKIRVSKFKAKSRYRRTIGFRPVVTMLEFENFGANKTSPKVKPAVKKTTKNTKDKK